MTGRRKSLLDPVNSHWDRKVTLDNVPKSTEPGAPCEPYTYTQFNRDDLRRLRMSNRLLEQLLERANREDLPAMSTWLVTPWSVVGEINPIGGPNPAGCREAFMAWVQALELDHVSDDKLNAAGWWKEARYDGKVELRGARKMPAPGAPHLEVNVSVQASWWTYDEEPEEGTVPVETTG